MLLSLATNRVVIGLPQMLGACGSALCLQCRIHTVEMREETPGLKWVWSCKSSAPLLSPVPFSVFRSIALSVFGRPPVLAVA